MLVWVLQNFFGFKYFSKMQLNLKNWLFLYNFSSFLLRYILWCLIKTFRNNNSTFFLSNFQFSEQADLRIRPSYQTINSAPDQNTKSKCNIIPSSVPPPNQTIRADHKITSTPLDHRPPSSKQNRIPNRLKWYRSGAFFMGWVKGGYIELWMNLAKHTFHTLSAWSFRILFRLNLTVVRLASGVPWAGKGLPFPFS